MKALSFRHGMTMRQPATRWQDALPVGNGSIGALVYGNIRSELIVLNHEDLWLRTPKPTLPDVSAHLGELRKLLADGRYKDGLAFMKKWLDDAGYSARVDPYHPAFDLAIDMETREAFSRYRRGVDFETAQAVVVWTEGRADYSRKTFVSRAHDVTATLISASGGEGVACRLSLIAHGLKAPQMFGSGPAQVSPHVPIEFRPSAEKGWLTMEARYTGTGGQFGGLARVVGVGGRQVVEDASMVIRGARSVLVLVKMFANEPAATALPRLRKELKALPGDYDRLLVEHVKGHRELFRRVSLDLHAGPERGLTNDELLAAAYEGALPTALIERMYEFGRYLLICSSRPGGLPANLQGVWNGDYTPAWDSDYHNDENVQMNYWQALPGNLPETTLPYFDYYERQLDDYRCNARNIFGCRGVMACIAQSTHGLVGSHLWLGWTAGAGWLAQLFHDYWLFTGDREFLARRVVPLLKEVAAFYEDFCVPGPDGKLMFSPSVSPENTPAIANGCLCTVNATMDVAVAREVLTNLCAACELLGIERDSLPRWREMLGRLPAYAVNADGALAEWIHPALKDNYRHRHLSHLYPVFPGIEVTAESHPRLFKAAGVAVAKRLIIGLTAQTGWSLAHMANIWARLGEGRRSLDCLELLVRSCVGSNLLTYHNDHRSQGVTMFWGHGGKPPFQIDANFGLSSAVLEMLLFSAPGMLKILPALPPQWPRGKAQGLRARGGITVALTWDLPHRRLQAQLRSDRAQSITLKLPSARPRVSCRHKGIVGESPLGKAYVQLQLPAGKNVTLNARL